MTDKGEKGGSLTKLRIKAEAVAREKPPLAPERIEELSIEETRRMLHELRVHQIELEMQNEELRRAQIDLNAARAKYFDLYDTAPVGYVTLNADGLVLEANLTARNMLAHPGELSSHPFTRFVLDQDRDIYNLHRDDLLKTGSPQGFELRVLRSGGRRLWARLDMTAAQDGEGEKVCRLVITDISKRKHEEAEKAKLEGQLQQARKMESVGRLAGGVAHDFNNMLMVILGYTEMAMDQLSRSEPLYEDLEKIHRAAKSSAELTRQLLAFARKQTISPKVQNLNDTVSGMVRMIERLIGENTKLESHFAADLWPVSIDPSQVDQILVHLCINARDAFEGGGTVVIETTNVVLDPEYCSEQTDCTPGEYVMLSVSDNGRGMTTETLDNIFEPFFTTKGLGAGAGLGLATVYGAVKQNNGFIIVNSSPGKGSTFKVHLPRFVGSVTPEPAVAANDQNLHGQETILLVEDDSAILQMAAMILKTLGYNVLSTSTPLEAIDMAKDHAGEIALLITDVVMPEMNGKELADTLLAIDPRIKKLFMSGYTADVIARNGVLEKGVNFIQKPFSVRDLAIKVREVLDEKPESGLAEVIPISSRR